ncbi:MAG: LD-carboxypeptidase [Deltaproteobacteria bacterium]|nr:LD-carboxypeptidase [Deltaproteobacteria bacterium]
MKKPRALTVGDEIVLVAPAGPFDASHFEQGVARLRDWGFQPVWRDDIFERDGYLAGCDQRRLAELQTALDGDAPCVWCVRGGYGTIRLIDRLDVSHFSRRPKLLIGFSDITILAWDLWRRAGVSQIHGPMVAGEQFQIADSGRDEWYLRLLREPSAPGFAPLGECVCVTPGRVTGRLFPGNLTLIVHLVAAGRCPDLSGAIPVIEDVGEAPYRVDRMLVTLRLSGALNGVAGIVFGEFGGVGEATIRQLATETSDALGRIPCAIGARFGHGARNTALPIGTLATLDATQGTLDLLESPVC